MGEMVWTVGCQDDDMVGKRVDGNGKKWRSGSGDEMGMALYGDGREGKMQQSRWRFVRDGDSLLDRERVPRWR